MVRGAKQGRRVGVEAQNAFPAERFWRGENNDFIGEPLPDQSRRQARAALAENPGQAARGQKSQRGIKIDAPPRVAVNIRDLDTRLAQARGPRFARPLAGDGQGRNPCRRGGKPR